MVVMQLFYIPKHRYLPRKKIDAILRRGDSVPDPDVPDDLESIRFWCFTSGKYTDREKVKVTGSTKANVRTTAEGVGSLVNGVEIPGSITPASSAAMPTLASLTDVVKGQQALAAAAAEPKAKAKAKAKVKKEKKEEPMDLKGKKTAGRTSS